MNSISIATSAALVFGTILCYASLIFWIGSVSGLFRKLTSLQILATCVALAPMALSWVYGAALRIAPAHAPLFYLLLIIAISIPFVCWTVADYLRMVPAIPFARARQVRQRWVERLAPGFLVAVLVAFMAIALSTNLQLPVSANDPMEYFTVARAIFLHQRLDGIYPVLDETVSKGFYGPWTHAPGYPLIISWLYLCQGTAAVAGIAKLFNVYAATSLALVVWAWSSSPFRWSGVVATLMVLIVPLFIRETFDMHVDIVRLAMWTSIICMIPRWLAIRNLSTSLAFGMLVGLAMFVHSLGVLFFGLFAGLLLLLQSGRLASRLGYGAVVVAISILVLLPDYLVNYARYGYFIGDSVPLWQLKAQQLIPFLNEQRGIGTTYEKVVNGVLGTLTSPSMFGWTTIAFAVALALYLIVLLRADFRTLPARLTRPTLVNTLILSMAAFLALLGLSAALGSNAMIKNVRYVATMSALSGIGAALISSKLLIWLGARRWWHLPSPGYIYVPVAIALAWVLLGDVRNQSTSRLQAFPVTEAQSNDLDAILACSADHSLRLVSEINKALAAEPGRQIKVLAFFPAGSAYHGRYPIVSYLDPRLVPAFAASSSAEGFAVIKSLGITHVLLPSYRMGEIEKTAFDQLLKDNTFFWVDKSIGGNQLLATAGTPSLFPDKPALLHVSPNSPVIFTTSDAAAFVAYDGVDIKCIRSIGTGNFNGEPYLTIKGSMIVSTRRHVEVDPGKRYRLSFDMRVPSESPGANTFVGLATYDANGVLETEAPGTYRYGVLDNIGIGPSSDWKHYSGIFTGAGNQTANQFRTGTRSVAPIFLLNYYNSDKSITQFRNVTFEQLD